MLGAFSLNPELPDPAWISGRRRFFGFLVSFNERRVRDVSSTNHRPLSAGVCRDQRFAASCSCLWHAAPQHGRSTPLRLLLWSRKTDSTTTHLRMIQAGRHEVHGPQNAAEPASNQFLMSVLWQLHVLAALPV